MTVRRIVPDLTTNRLEESREFYTAVLGLQVGMDMGWIVTLVSRENPLAQLNLIQGDPPADTGPAVAVSIEVGDVDAVHDAAVAAGSEIVYPLTNEPWGVRRFHVRDPNGVCINVMRHLD